MGKKALPIVLGVVGALAGAVTGGAALAPLAGAAGAGGGAIGGGAAGAVAGAGGVAAAPAAGALVGGTALGTAGAYVGEALTPDEIKPAELPAEAAETPNRKQRKTSNVRRSGSVAQAISATTGASKLGGTA